jgi:orotidine 5'-phosphate decarboxylase subfamily 2
MFRDELRQISQAHNSLLCVGLDPYDVEPKVVAGLNRALIEATADLVCAYKPNLAIYEGMGPLGLEALQETLDVARSHQVPTIGDGKRGDIENCGKAYAASLFDRYGFGAVTISPLMGSDVATPFLDSRYSEHLLFVLVKTSNKSSGDFQNLTTVGRDGQSRPFFLELARQCSSWGTTEQIGFVVGATYPSEIQEVRSAYPESMILIPGVGTQGGQLTSAVRNAIDATGGGFVLSVSRAITFAEGQPERINEKNIAVYAKAARQAAIDYRDQINAALSTVRV